MGKVKLVEVKEIPEAVRQKGRWMEIVQQFLDSGMKKAKIETDTKAINIYPTVRRAIKVLGKEGTMAALKRGNDLYLVKRRGTVP